MESNDKLQRFKGTVLASGYGIVAKKAMQDRSLHMIAKAIYSYLCTFGEGAFPSRDLICSDLSINKDTFHKYLNELKKTGYISVKSERSGGKFMRNVYTIEQIISPCPITPDVVKKTRKRTSPCLRPPDTIPPDTMGADNNSTSINNTTINNTTNNIVVDELEKMGTTKSGIKEITNAIDEITTLALIKYAKENNLGAGWIRAAARDPSRRPPPPGSEAAEIWKKENKSKSIKQPAPNCPKCHGRGGYSQEVPSLTMGLKEQWVICDCIRN